MLKSMLGRPASSQQGNHPLQMLSAFLKGSLGMNWGPRFLLMDKVHEEALLPWDV